MNETDVREDFARYRNGFGLVDNEPTQPDRNSGNAILFHAHYVWAMRNRGFWDQYDRQITRGCVRKCEIEPGLIRRAPEGRPFWNDQEGPDDQIGYISMSGADPLLPFADNWLHYGRTVRVPIRQALEAGGRKRLALLFGWIHLHWVFNTKAPGTLIEWRPAFITVAGESISSAAPNWTAWMGRFPQIIAHAQFAADERPWLGRRLWWAFSVWQAARFWDKEGTDQWILAWHLVATFRASRQSSWICEWVSRNFTERLFTRFPGGLNTVFAQYFGAEHPTTRFFLP
jgi:hypothetical protein